ncbi:MAG TPA: sigma-70 family RNA polymerase sigma factor [bacterium]|nr:sigma-70 family RNA polymerase sigma factor [bacterium]
MSAIQCVQSGEVNAYSVIFEICDDSLRSFISMSCWQLGGDFVSEVAIRTHEYALKHLAEYDSDKGASFQTWLNWQSLNVAAQVMAERCGHRFVQRDEGKHDAYLPSAAGPEAAQDVKERDQALRQELKALPEDERLTIAHHDLAGRTFAETAQATGLTVRQVRYKRERALAVMKRRLQERGFRPVEVDSTPAPIFYGWDHTEPDDEYTTSVTAILPDGPDTLVGAAAHDLPEDEVEK